MVGHYSPGYIYGNCKIHKNSQNPPLRPIISQVLSPTYDIAKTLNKLILPYIPNKYAISSTDEFIQTIQSNQNNNGILASLDVENLFTNVPVESTIDIILNYVYRSNQRPLKIPEKILQELLKTCTTEAPFRHIDGSLFLEKITISIEKEKSKVMFNEQCEIKIIFVLILS